MTASEFPRPVRLDTVGAEPRTIAVEAADAERAALARRFGLQAIARLEATVTVRREGQAVVADGRVRADATQTCTATGEPVPAHVDEPFCLRFAPAGAVRDEVELDADDLDVLPLDGGAVDLGEAVAQEFSLALDPFPRAPGAEQRLRAAGVLDEAEADALADEQRRADSPFAVLKGLGSDG